MLLENKLGNEMQKGCWWEWGLLSLNDQWGFVCDGGTWAEMRWGSTGRDGVDTQDTFKGLDGGMKLAYYRLCKKARVTGFSELAWGKNSRGSRGLNSQARHCQPQFPQEQSLNRDSCAGIWFGNMSPGELERGRGRWNMERQKIDMKTHYPVGLLWG